MNSRHNLTKSEFRNVASPMQSEWHLQTEKLLSFTWLTVLRLNCSLHANLCVRNYVAILSAQKYWKFERGVFTRQYWWFAFVFQIVALKYLCLGVFLSIGVFDKLIRAVSVKWQLAEKKRPVIRYTIIYISHY